MKKNEFNRSLTIEDLPLLSRHLSTYFSHFAAIVTRPLSLFSEKISDISLFPILFFSSLLFFFLSVFTYFYFIRFFLYYFFLLVFFSFLLFSPKSLNFHLWPVLLRMFPFADNICAVKPDVDWCGDPFPSQRNHYCGTW